MSATLRPSCSERIYKTVNQQAAAAALYATLAGRISSITRNARLNEETNRYTLQGDLISRAQQSEYGPDGFGARFIFPRTVDGLPFILTDVGEVRFYSELAVITKLNVRFKVSDLMYEGKLEY